MCFKNEKANLSSERAMAACLNSRLLASSLKKPHPSWKKMDPSYCSLIWHEGEILARTNRYLENTWAALSKNYIDQQSFTKEGATADTHELEMEWRYQLARIKGVRISVLSSYTGTKQTQTKLRAHRQNTAFTWHTQKRRWTLCFKKRLLPCLGLVLQNQLALLTNSLLRKWVQEELTCVWQYQHNLI